jgi:hypothetical protein
MRRINAVNENWACCLFCNDLCGNFPDGTAELPLASLLLSV